MENTQGFTKHGYPHIDLFVPSNFNPEEVPNYLGKRHHHKYLLGMNNMVYGSLITKGRNKTFGESVTLRSETIRDYMGSRYYPEIWVNGLTKDGQFIDKVSSYYHDPKGINSQACRYKLNPKYVPSPTNGVTIKRVTITDEPTCRRFYKWKDTAISERIKKDENLAHELYMLTQHDIKKEEATAYVHKTYEKDSPQFTTRMVIIEEISRLKDARYTDDRWNMPFRFKVDRGGRLHHPLSHIPKDLERFVYQSDSGTVEIDQRFSQLAYFHKFGLEKTADIQRMQAKKKCHKIGGKELPNTTTIHPKVENDRTSVGSHSLQGSSSYHVTIDLSTDDAWKTALFNPDAIFDPYQLLMKSAKYKGSREDAKEKVFGGVYYNELVKGRQTKWEKAMKHVAPHEYKRLRFIKGMLGNRELAVQVTRVESHFWHKIVVGYMRTQHPDTLFFIKHDAIFLPAEQANDILEDISQMGKTFFGGNQPQFKMDVIS